LIIPTLVVILQEEKQVIWLLVVSVMKYVGMYRIELNNEVQKGTKMCRATEIFQGMCFGSMLSSRANLL
jgi:hypothetical protein